MGLGDLFSNKAAKSAANQANAGILIGNSLANSALDKGLEQTKGYYDQASGLYGQLAGTGAAANKTYADALGLNGADAAAAARSSYTTTPGYDFQMDQGLQALDRQRAASGSMASGGASADAMKFAQGLASQDYNSWMDRLMGLNTQYGNTTNAQAAITTGLGDKYYDTGQSKANLGWATGTGIGNNNATAEMNRYNVAGNVLGGISMGAKLLGFNM